MDGLAHGNLVDSSTITSLGSASVGHGVEKLQERELAAYWQSASSGASDCTLDFDHGSAKAARLFAFFAHDLASTVTVDILRGSTQGSSGDLNLTGVAAWPFTPIDSVYDGGYFGVFVVAPATTTSRWTRVRFNSALAVRVGRPFIGPIEVPTYQPNFTDNADDWMPSLSSVDRTESGADWVHERPVLRRKPFTLRGLTPASASRMKEIVRTHNTTHEVVWLQNMQRPAYRQQDSFLGLFEKLAGVQPHAHNALAMGISINERGGAP
jgi:hypothetical protein